MIGPDTNEFYLTHGSASRSKAAAGLKHQGYSAFDGYSLERYRICLGLLLFIWRKNRQLLQVVNSFCSQWKELTWRMKENEREKVNPALEKSEHSSKRLKEKDVILILLENQLCGTITSQALLNWTRYSKPCDPSHRVVRLWRKFLQQAWHFQGTFISNVY